MSDDALYQDRIMALARAGAGDHLMDTPDRRVIVDNPLCGDRVTLDLAFDNGVVGAIGHKVRGCALCEASAALIAAAAPGSPPDRLKTVAEAAQALLQQGDPAPDGWPDLEAFRPVAAAKSRHRCVLLPFEALVMALDSEADSERDS